MLVLTVAVPEMVAAGAVDVGDAAFEEVVEAGPDFGTERMVASVGQEAAGRTATFAEESFAQDDTPEEAPVV